MTQKRNWTGIVACGGKSARMGRDKSRLTYHVLPQREHLFQMLDMFCAETFLSCSAEQEAEADTRIPVIVDHPLFEGAGPLTGLLSAMRVNPGNPILLLACDYPLLRREDWAAFVGFVDEDPSRPAAFYDSEAQSYVPVLGYYPDSARQELMASVQVPGFSLQRYLKKEAARKFIPPHADALISVDDEQMMGWAKEKLKWSERDYQEFYSSNNSIK